ITPLYDEAGRHVGFSKITRDLTESSYRAFVEATNTIVWTTDADGHPNADSPSWRAFTGQSIEDWRGLHNWDAVHPDDEAMLKETWHRARTEHAILEVEFRLRRRDG